jgi:elongation factor Ts
VVFEPDGPHDAQRVFLNPRGRLADEPNNLAMQIAAMNPLYLDEADMPSDDKRKPEEVCLLKQAFIKDSGKTIGDLIMDVRAKVGENVRVSRFVRYSLGQ